MGVTPLHIVKHVPSVFPAGGEVASKEAKEPASALEYYEFPEVRVH